MLQRVTKTYSVSKAIIVTLFSTVKLHSKQSSLTSRQRINWAPELTMILYKEGGSKWV